MSQIYENQYILNSFHAVNADTEEVIDADEIGLISPDPDTEIVFANPNADSKYKYVEVNSLVFTTTDSALKVIINDNEMYPFYVAPNSTKGLNYVYISKFKVLEGSAFYYEALSSRT